MTIQALRDDEIARLLAQINELQQRVMRGSLDIPVVRRGLQHLIENQPVVGCQPASHFVSLAQQVANLERWNAEFDWGFTDADIARRCLEARTFNWPGDSLQAIVLVPTLDSPAATFVALTQIGDLRVWPSSTLEFITHDTTKLWLMEGVEFRPHTLEWRLVDLGSHLQPRNVRRTGDPIPHASQLVTAQTAAHAEVLAAAAHFPGWLQAVYDKRAPTVAIPGYRIIDPSFDYGGPSYLSISFSSGDIDTTLHVWSSDTVWDDNAVATAGPVELGGNI